MTYGEKLTALRNGRPRHEIAEAIGISPSAYAMYEREERMPRDRIKIKLANFYKTTVQTIFFDE